MSLSPHVPVASGAPQAPATPRTSPLRRWIIVLLCIAAMIYFGGDYVIAYTDDAYVQSDFVPIAQAPTFRATRLVAEHWRPASRHSLTAL